MGLSASAATAAGHAGREYSAMFRDLGTSLDCSDGPGRTTNLAPTTVSHHAPIDLVSMERKMER